MLPALRLTVSLHSDETPMSVASRLAARNGTTLRSFCSDFGLRFQGIVDGDGETLQRTAGLARINANVLQSVAFVKSGRWCWVHRGTELHRTVLRRAHTAICPACALADIDANPALRPNAAVYGRCAWMLDPLLTCPVHRIPLSVVPLDHQRMHDFADSVGILLPKLVDLAATGERRDLGALERYAIARLAGAATSPLLDQMSLAAAAHLCETAGAVLISGPKVNLSQLTADERLAAGGRGCQAIAAGPDAFRALLDQLIEAKGPRVRNDSPRAAFGQLYKLLSPATADNRGFEAVRDIMRQHAVDNFALPGGSNLLGAHLERRRVHSVHTLANEYAIHPKTLRKHLRAAGLIDAAQAEMSDNNIRIEADAAVELARHLAGTLSLADAMEHINAPRAQMDVLIKAGIVTPQQRMTGFGGQNLYAAADLDDLMARLTAKARTARRHDARLHSIPTAAKRCCCSAADIVRLIVDGKLRTAKTLHRLGYMGILVDARAVLKAVRGAETDALSLRKAARTIGTSDPALEALIAGGHIAAFTGVNAVNRCPQTLVANKELKRFKANYVSLWALSKERGMYIATLKSKLDRAGIEPAFDPGAIGASFYRRIEVSRTP
jgi:hypothetical protein